MISTILTTIISIFGGKFSADHEYPHRVQINETKSKGRCSSQLHGSKVDKLSKLIESSSFILEISSTNASPEKQICDKKSFNYIKYNTSNK